ncbi:MAG: hypothetical protein WC238_04730 [Parcubacteria group bacterium]|jgi:hypothetical protein
MQKIILEITTVNDAKPQAVAETLEQMTGRKCRLVTPPSEEEMRVNANGIHTDTIPLSGSEKEIFIMGAKFTKDWMTETP